MSSKFTSPIQGLPTYDPKKNKASNIFTTVYLGSYKSNSFAEGAGSHCGVDISTRDFPDGATEVFAIADGEVVKAKESSSGFGKHIVIKHAGILDPADSSKTTTLFSCYNHLSKIKVKEKQKVSASEVIGFSGSSGTSTSPHLHFQIDRDTAPWHPYWPFSSQEAKEAGLNFFEAINEGLGKANVLKHTVNPLVYVQSSLKEKSAVVKNESVKADSDTKNKADANSDQEDKRPENSSQVKKTTTQKSFFAEATEDVPDNQFSDVPKKHSHYKTIKWLVEKKIVQGYPDGTFCPEKTVTRTELLKMTMKLYKTPLLTGQKIVTFKDIKKSEWFWSYVTTAAQNGWVGGFPDGTFQPHKEVIRAEGFKIILNIAEVNIPQKAKGRVAKDVTKNNWAAPYVQVAFEKKLLEFKAKKFLPTKKLTRGEVAEILHRLNA